MSSIITPFPCIFYINVQEGRSGMKGTMVLYLGDPSVCLSSSYKHKGNTELIFFFFMTRLKVDVDGKIFLSGGRWASGD